MRKTAKWHNPPEEVSEDDLLIGEELKLFQSVSGQIQFSCYGPARHLVLCERADEENGLPRAQVLIALQESCTIHNQIPRMAGRYFWTPLDSNIEVFGDANFAGCHSTRKSMVGGIAMWSGQFVFAWSKTMALLALSSGESELAAVVRAATEGMGVAIDSERLLSVWSCGNQIGRNCRNWDGSSTWSGKSPTLGCGRLVGWVVLQELVQRVRESG